MTRFGHKLNYVINTFVKRTPAGIQSCVLNDTCHTNSDSEAYMIKSFMWLFLERKRSKTKLLNI